MRDLFAEYLAGEEPLMAFYESRLSRLDSGPVETRPWDSRLIEELRAYQREIGGTAGFGGTEAVVVTGQQPGIFTGPLYSIYKAATAVRLARRVHEQTGVPCVPMFWVAGDDHDFEEARTIAFLAKSGEPVRIEYAPEMDVADMPMYRVPLGEPVHVLIDRMARETRGSELAVDVAAFLHESAHASGSLADWTARLLAHLFADTGLIIFSPDLPAARAASRPVLARAIEEPLVSALCVNEAGHELSALGYSPMIVKGAGDCGFFIEVEGRRRKVLFEGDRFRLPAIETEFSPARMRTFLESEPERFSPNVALRCLVQQHLFPVAAYVGGPGEVAYWAQFGGLFRRFGLSMPVVYPRARAVLVYLKLGRLMRKYGIEAGDALRGSEELTSRILSGLAASPAAEEVRMHGRQIGASLEALTAALTSHDAVAADMSRALHARLTAELARIEQSILTRDAAQVEAARSHAGRICDALAPWRKPQERVYTVYSFLFEYGDALVRRIVDELDIGSFAVNEVEL